MPFVQEGNDRDEIRMELEKLGCKVEFTGNKCFRIKGDISRITKVSKLLKELGKKTESLDNESFFNIISIPMSKRWYKVLMHFVYMRDRFKQYRNSINFDGHCLICLVPTNEYEKIKEDIANYLQEVKQMPSVSYQITEESKESIQDLAKHYPNVYFFVKDKSMEMISDSYEDVVKLQDMLKQKTLVKTSRRAARRFAKYESTENQRELSSRSNACKTGDNTFDTVRFTSQTTTPSIILELKTAKGLLIKVYTGSITKLNVDCIVNAANEKLMHGGGVAAEISDAAGYEFDNQSAQYIAANGPVPVGSCCVTSAGKLPYRCVIHTVGPRWGDYRDSNVCLEILKISVKVSFETADMKGMNSVAIPAISSGIFGVPKDMCVKQYYKAAMSFCSTYHCTSLKEIHFVDRDESMIRAIKQVFQQKQPATSTTLTAMSKNPLEQDDVKEDTKLLDIKKIEMPPPSGYTIVTVSDTLQIKIYLGSIIDIAADVIVCPQDEICSSDNPIARGIFSKEPGPKPLPNQMKQGQTLSQIPSDASPWKMIIHAAFPIYSDNYAKNPCKFGSQFYHMFQTLITTADERRYHSIAIPLLVEGKGDFQAPMELCAFYFYKAVTDAHSKLDCVKEIYLVLRNEDDEHIFVDMFKDAVKITPRPLL